MASLSDLLLQQSMRNPHGGVGQTILLLISMLVEAGFKAWSGRRSAYAKLAHDLDNWRIISKDNPYTPIGDALRPRNPVLNVLSRIQLVCYVQPESQAAKDNKGKTSTLARVKHVARGIHSHNRYSYAKRLLKKEGIGFKVSQGAWRGFICVQESDRDRARQALSDAGLTLPVLMGDVPHTVDAEALGMSGDELARRLSEIGFDAAAHDQEVIVTFDKAHDPVLLATALTQITQEGAAQDAAAEQANGHDRKQGGREREREAPVKDASRARGQNYNGPITDKQRALIEKLLAVGLVSDALKDDLRSLKTTGEATDFLNTHAEELGTGELRRDYRNKHADVAAAERRGGCTEEGEEQEAPGADKTAVKAVPVAAPER